MLGSRVASTPVDQPWVASPERLADSNVGWLVQRVGAASDDEFHAWSVKNRADYWRLVVERLGVRFDHGFRAC